MLQNITKTMKGLIKRHKYAGYLRNGEGDARLSLRTGREDVVRLYAGRYVLPKADRYRPLTGAIVRMFVPTASGEREILSEVVLTEAEGRTHVSGRSRSSRNGVWVVPSETIENVMDIDGQPLTMSKLPCSPEYVRGSITYHVRPIWTDPSPNHEPSFFPRAYFVERKRIIEVIAESISAHSIEAVWAGKAKAKRLMYRRAARKRKKTIAAKKQLALEAAAVQGVAKSQPSIPVAKPSATAGTNEQKATAPLRLKKMPWNNRG